MAQRRLAVIYYSRSGTVAMLARHIAEGAELAGAQTRVRLVPNPGRAGTAAEAPPPSLADLEWADALAFGSPTRFGNLAAELKTFLDSTGPLARTGKLANKAVAGFTSAASPHGGQEATLLALYHTMCHWGAVIVPTGYTDPSLHEIGGNPYGLSVTARHDGSLSAAEVAAARFFGTRLAEIGARLAAPSGEPVPQPAADAAAPPAGGALPGEPAPPDSREPVAAGETATA